MGNVAKVCVSLATGAGLCTTAPAWATVAIVVTVTAGTAYVFRK